MWKHLVVSLWLVLKVIPTVRGAFECPPGVADDFFPDPESCDVFYRCANGQQYRFTCGPGTVFNPSTRNCDWPSAVTCGSSPEPSKYEQPPSGASNGGYQQKPNYPGNSYPYDNGNNNNYLPERNVNPSENNNNNGANPDNYWTNGQSRVPSQPDQSGWNSVNPSSGQNGYSQPGETDVPYGSGQQPQENWNNPRPDSSSGVRQQVRPDNPKQGSNQRQPSRYQNPNGYTNPQSGNRQPEVVDNYGSSRPQDREPKAYNKKPGTSKPKETDDGVDERSFGYRNPNRNEGPDEDSIESDGKRPWKVPTPRKDSAVDWNEKPPKPSPVNKDKDKNLYDPYEPSARQEQPNPRQRPSSSRNERPSDPLDTRSNRPQPPQNRQREPTSYPDERNYDRPNQSRRPYQPKPQTEETTDLPDSPIVYRPAKNRDRGRDDRGNNARQDNRRDNVRPTEEDQSPWDSQPRSSSFSDDIEPSPDLAQDPNQQRKPNQAERDDQNEPGEQNQRANPKSNARNRYRPNQPSEFESQRLNPDKNLDKSTDKDPETDEEAQAQYKGKSNKPTPQPDDRWNKNQPSNMRGKDDRKRKPSSPYAPKESDIPEDPEDAEDPATRTQWYKPKLNPDASTSENSPYETPLNRPGDRRRERDPNVSTSPYADRRNEPRKNPNPRPVYRPDRRQGEARPTPSEQKRGPGRQQPGPSKPGDEDRWGEQPQKSKQPPRSPDQQRQQDPWKRGQEEPEPEEQYKEDSEPTFESSNVEPRFPDESEVAEVMNDMYVQDPYSMPDLMTNLPCNETTLPDCEKCEKLKWLKLGHVTLRAQPDEAIRTPPEHIVTDCFRRCHSQGCIAYTYNQQKGHCKLYYGGVNEENIESDPDFVTIIKEPTSALLADQWLYTDNSEPVGKDMGQFNSEDSISCLRVCINNGDNCKAISYNMESKLCKIYDSMNGERLKLTGGRVITLQHISIHNKGDSWRFSSLGSKTFNTSIPAMTFAIREDQECFEECLNTQGCLAISIEGRSPKECQVFTQLDSLSSSSSDSESDAASQSSAINTYLVKTPLNSSQFLQLPGLYFAGKPIKKYEQFDLNDCKEAVKSLPNATKVTYLKESQICYVFSDAAKIGLWKNPQIEAITFLVSLPADPKYLAYKRLPGLTLTKALLAPKGEKYPSTSSAIGCLDSCLKTANCSAVSVTYSEVQDSVECILMKDEDLEGKPRLIFKEDTDLFVRTLPTNLVPELGEKDDQCSLRINTPSADDNLPYYEKEKSKKQSEPSLLEKAEKLVNRANPFHNKKSSQLKQSPDEEENEMMPHGLEFEGMIDESNEEEAPLREFGERQRDKRSIYAMTLRGASVYDEALEQKPDKNPLEAGAEAGFAIRELLSGALGISENNSTENVLLSRFLKRAQDVSKNPKLEDDIVSSIKSSARKVRSNEGDPEEDFKSCKITKGSSVKETKCRPDEICTNVPYIIHGDEKALSSCSGTRVNSTCTVTCKSGYRANKNRLVCEVLGSTPTWNTKDISCVSDDSMCSELPWILFSSSRPGSDEKRLHYLVKYDESKRLPLLAVYKMGSSDPKPEANQTEVTGRAKRSVDDTIVALPCSQLKSNQLSNMNYKQSNYTKGYLVPPAAFPANPEARKMVNYYVNTAPQDGFTSQGPWAKLTDTLHNYFKSSNQSGFIINGVCNQQIFSPSTSALPVPKCFWKTVCTRTQAGLVTAATFYHDNRQIDEEDESNRKKRFEEVFSYTNPEFVKSLIGAKDYDSLWPEILDRFSTSSSKTVSDEMMILQCAAAGKIDTKYIDFWNEILLNGTENPHDKPQADDLSTAESQIAPVTSQKLTQASPSQQSSANPSASSSADCDKKLIGYIGLNGDEIKEELITESAITHLTLLGAVKIAENGSLSLGNETQKIYDRLYALKALRNKNPALKVLIALGGWSNSQYFTKISRSPNIQKTFIMDILAFLDYWEFDGVDIVWQYPNLGGKVKGSPEDKENLNRLMQNIKDSMVDHSSRNARPEPYSLVLTGPGLYWILDHGYDLKTLVNHVDWINVMAFDFHGPWNSSWGDYTGPMAPLYFGAPDGFPGKLNVDSIVKRYACETGRPDKLVLGIGFFGRTWTSAGNHVDEGKDDLFRKAGPVKDGSKGSFITYRKLREEWLAKGEPVWHNKTRTNYLYNKAKRSLVSFESEDSIKEKVAYADAKGLGGLMVWSLDIDDSEGTLFKSIGNGLSCPSGQGKKSQPFKCNPLNGEKRHWTQYDEDGSKDRLCGKRAPLINGYYPICDPDDSGYSCCSSNGFCGSGPQFCECEGCVDYGNNPDRVLNDSVIPSNPEISWLTTDLIEDMAKPDCGLNAQKMVNESGPTCNPEDPKRHCCSATGFCGTGPDYCECKGCVNFNTNSTQKFPVKNWFDWSDGPENAGRCGPQAPRIKGRVAGCDPSSDTAHCCGPNGYCGTGPDYCSCKECINFTAKPIYDWS